MALNELDRITIMESLTNMTDLINDIVVKLDNVKEEIGKILNDIRD